MRTPRAKHDRLLLPISMQATDATMIVQVHMSSHFHIQTRATSRIPTCGRTIVLPLKVTWLLSAKRWLGVAMARVYCSGQGRRNFSASTSRSHYYAQSYRYLPVCRANKRLPTQEVENSVSS
jgi:hypothetical protein